MSTTTRLIKPARRSTLAAPAALPEVQSERAEAAAWFAGMWHGIAMGAVIGAGIAVLLLQVVGRLA
jgi:hypothetical protein